MVRVYFSLHKRFSRRVVETISNMQAVNMFACGLALSFCDNCILDLAASTSLSYEQFFSHSPFEFRSVIFKTDSINVES